MALFPPFCLKQLQKQLLFFSHTGCGVLSPRACSRAAEDPTRARGKPELHTSVSQCQNSQPDAHSTMLEAAPQSVGLRDGVLCCRDHKVTMSLECIIVASSKKKKTPLFCTGKTRQALSAPGRCLHREHSISNVTCSQSLREFCSMQKYPYYSYVINTWKSRLDQSVKMLK